MESEPEPQPQQTLEARAAADGALFRQLVTDGYDQCADAYLAKHAKGDPDEMRMKSWGAVAAALPEGAHVLDAGCGAGVPVAKSIVEDERQLRVTGVDISPRQIELAKELVVSPRATFLCGDVSALSFEDGSFDAVCAFFSVFHLPRRDHEEFFRRVAAWLKPGGTFVFNLGSGADDREGEAGLETDFLGTTMVWSSHSRDKTVELLRSAGFELVSEEVETVTEGDRVDDAGLQFCFYTCTLLDQPAYIGGDLDGPRDGYAYNISGEHGAGYYKHGSREVLAAEPDNFINDSALMIAFERALESSRPDALVHDPFALAMAGKKGEELSASFGGYCVALGFAEWPEFHKVWTAVRTKFIDDQLKTHAASGDFTQLVNLGAGVDTRPYRLEFLSAFTAGSFDVDMEAVNAAKAAVFEHILGEPPAHCPVHTLNLDFLDEEKTLATELGALAAFDPLRPSVFFAEGLIMYLGKRKRKLLVDVSAVAAEGSVFILQFFGSETDENPMTLSPADATSILTELGWTDLEFSRYGDERLNFGRFPTDQFEPSLAFSFVVCRRGAAPEAAGGGM